MGVFNFGLTQDTMTLKGPPGGNGFTVTYLNGQYHDITAQVVAGTYAPDPNLPTGFGSEVQLVVTVASNAKVGAVRSFPITATSTGGAVVDAVKAKVTVGS